jgi:hypothetical protein
MAVKPRRARQRALPFLTESPVPDESKDIDITLDSPLTRHLIVIRDRQGYQGDGVVAVHFSSELNQKLLEIHKEVPIDIVVIKDTQGTPTKRLPLKATTELIIAEGEAVLKSFQLTVDKKGDLKPAACVELAARSPRDFLSIGTTGSMGGSTSSTYQWPGNTSGGSSHHGKRKIAIR